MANIKTRRALSDLFKEGVEVRFGTDPETKKPRGRVGPFEDENGKSIPPSPGEVQMYVRPPDPLQRDLAMRDASAKRARAIVKAKRDEDSEEHLTILAFLADMSDETLIDYVLLADMSTRQGEAEREILALDEWKEMTAYQDAMRQFENMKTEDLAHNEEWQALMELDQKYAEQVSEREMQLADAEREALRMLDRSVVETRALEKRADMAGSQAFIVEYERQMRYYSCREWVDQNALFFGTADECSGQPDEVLNTISEALLPFISDGIEAKNSSGAAPGSDSSGPPNAQETSDSSTQEERTT